MPEDQNLAIQAFEEKQKKLYTKGKIIVATIAIGHVAFSVVDIFLHFDGFSPLLLILPVIFAIALFRGVSWVRYVWGVNTGLEALYTLFLLFGDIIDFSSTESSLLIYAIIGLLVVYFIYCVVSCVALLTGKAVSEFLYAQKNG